MAQIPGVKDLGLQRDTGEPNLNITVDRQAAARWGINVADVQDAIQTAVGGFPDRPSSAGRGRLQPDRALSEAISRYERGHSGYSHSLPFGRARVSGASWPKCRSKMAPTTSTAKTAHAMSPFGLKCVTGIWGPPFRTPSTKINQNVQLPRGYHLKWAGEYESEKRAEARLLVIVPITILLIFIILYTMFRSVKWALLILTTVAMARVGGLLALLVTAYFLQRRLGRWLPGALRRIGANRRHHARIHQPAPRPRSYGRGCRGRRRCPAGFAPS